MKKIENKCMEAFIGRKQMLFTKSGNMIPLPKGELDKEIKNAKARVKYRAKKENQVKQGKIVFCNRPRIP